MGLLPIYRLRNVFNPAACSASHPASVQASLQMLLHKNTKMGGTGTVSGRFLSLCSPGGKSSADPGGCVSLNPSFHCSKVFA